MRLYRIAKRKHIEDLSGTVARLYRGRWNSIGVSVLYTSSTQALAILETLVYTALDILPKDLCLGILEVPDNVKYRVFEDPENNIKYNACPTRDFTQQIGDQFIQDNAFVMLKVPSIISRSDFNFVLNPAHPDFSALEIRAIAPFTFDQRLTQIKQ